MTTIDATIIATIGNGSTLTLAKYAPGEYRIEGTFPVEKVTDLNLPNGHMSLATYAIRAAAYRDTNFEDFSTENEVVLYVGSARSAAAIWAVFVTMAMGVE